MIGADDLRKAEDSAKNIDVIGLILSRPVPAFTELTTLATGITKMPFLKFLFVIIFTNFGVAIVFFGLGAAAISSGSSTLAFLGTAILPALLYFTYKRFNKLLKLVRG